MGYSPIFWWFIGAYGSHGILRAIQNKAFEVLGHRRPGPITPRQQDLRAQLELPQLQTWPFVQLQLIFIWLLVRTYLDLHLTLKKWPKHGVFWCFLMFFGDFSCLIFRAVSKILRLSYGFLSLDTAWGVRCRDGYQVFPKLLGDEHPRIVYPASRSTQNITYQTWDIKQGKDMSASSPWIARKDWLENMV